MRIPQTGLTVPEDYGFYQEVRRQAAQRKGAKWGIIRIPIVANGNWELR